MMKGLHRSGCGAGVVGVLAAAGLCSGAGAQWTVTVLHPPQARLSEATAIDYGGVVGRVKIGVGDYGRPVLWTLSPQVCTVTAMPSESWGTG